jgi:ATPase subunit of ABC transporter with duplicated ATPase domains
MVPGLSAQIIPARSCSFRTTANFSTSLCTHIVEIRQSKLIRYTRQLRRLPRTARRAEEQLLAAYKISSARSRRMHGIRRPLPRQEHQGRAGAEQAQADRAHGKNRGAGERDEPKIGFRFPQPQRSGQKVITLKTSTRLRRKRDLSRHEFPGRARPAHRAGRAERRGQIHPAENSRRRAHAAIRHAQAGPQRQGRLLIRSTASRC